MVGMCLALVALGVEIARGSISIAFGRRVAEIALGVFTVLVFWNFEAWIVNRNIDRATQNGKFDLDYAMSLSKDAIPTLISRRSEIPTEKRDLAEAWLSCVPLPAERRWFEWNRSVRATDRALRAAKASRDTSQAPCTNRVRVTPPPASPDTVD
jgi:hypothetical protein